MTDAFTHVYLTKGRLLMISNRLKSDLHRHHAVQITTNLEDKPFNIEHANSKTLESSTCIIIKQNYQHRIEANACRMLLLLEPTSIEALKINRRFLQQNNLATPEKMTIDFIRDQLKHFNQTDILPIEKAALAVDNITHHLSGSQDIEIKSDRRIDRAIDFIHQANGKDVGLNEIADAAALSPSRLSHLFSDIIGIPIKRYLLWYKLCQTCLKMFTGGTIADAALDSGFADAAHFSRTCRKMFGMAPTQFVKESVNVKLAADINI